MSATNITIAGRAVGAGHPCLIIGEIAQTHDGSLGTAHAYVEAIARAGADAIKFQTHIASAESTPGEPFRVKFSPQDATRYEYWKRMEWTPEQWGALAAHARDRGLIFLSSAFSSEAVELLERIGMAAWKVGSGEVTNTPLLKKMAATGKPIILSSGLSTWADLDQAVAVASRGTGGHAVLQCTTSYPCPPEQTGLNVIAELRQRYACPVGLSDHSAAPHAGLAAVTLGANLLEVHVAFNRECFGPDVSSSLTTAELKTLVEGTRFIEKALAHPIDKDREAAARSELRTIFGKSVVAARDLPAGHELAESDLALKKPGTGIPAAQLDRVVGRRLRRALAADTMLEERDLE